MTKAKKSAPKKKLAAKGAAPKKVKKVAKKTPTLAPAKKTSAPPRSDDRRSSVSELKADEHKRVEQVLGGWPAGVTTYRIAETWYCKVDNVSPGATVARGRGKTREEAVEIATTAATRRLGATRVHR